MAIYNALYAQSGGVTAVINATACGVIQTARHNADKIGTLLAARNGIMGVLTEDLIDTSLESEADIAALRHTPGGAFGSCRHKLGSFEKNRAQYERLIDVFAAHNIHYFFYNGGGDSQIQLTKWLRQASLLITLSPVLAFPRQSTMTYLLPIILLALVLSPNMLLFQFAKRDWM